MPMAGLLRPFQSEPRRNRGRRHTMLAGAGFRDHTGFAHVSGQQALPHGVVDLVRAGVIQIFPLEQNLCPTAVRGQAAGVINWRGTPDVLGQVIIQPGHELLIAAPACIGLTQLFQCVHQRFRDVTTAVRPEMAKFIW